MEEVCAKCIELTGQLAEAQVAAKKELLGLPKDYLTASVCLQHGCQHDTVADVLYSRAQDLEHKVAEAQQRISVVQEERDAERRRYEDALGRIAALESLLTDERTAHAATMAKWTNDVQRITVLEKSLSNYESV